MTTMHATTMQPGTDALTEERAKVQTVGQAAAAQPVSVKLGARNLVAGYGEATILKGITMDIMANEVTAIIGPSGCGKSTFIRCLNRMHELVPNAFAHGQVGLDNTDIYSPEVDPVLLRRRIGMVFQKPNPFPTMTIRENVLAGLTLTGQLKRANADEIVERSLTGAALWDEVKDKLDQPGTSLSGGQQQRLCIARTLAVEPDVILMDEPCSALDPVATAKIEELIDQLKTDYTVVIVTHNMQQAARCSDRTAFFLMGEVIEYKDTDTIFTKPSDRRTEDYVTGKFG